MPKPTPRSANDLYVGNRIRLRRMLIGLSMEGLGDTIGLTYQQVQKYERGINRVGAGLLFTISRVLGVSVDYFYEGLSEQTTAASASLEQQLLPEVVSINLALCKIEDALLRKHVVAYLLIPIIKSYSQHSLLAELAEGLLKE